VSKRAIFSSDEDYQFFLYKLFFYQRKYNIEIKKFCILPNHFHLLIRTAKNPKNISDFMKNLQITYARYFNRNRNHSGHVFQGAYKNKNINSQRYMKEVIAYIENNPVKHGIVKEADLWKYRG
jgi:REP element-mobilizing transposase RayT